MANIDNVQLPDGSSYNIVDNTSGFATQNYVDSAVDSITKTTIGLGNVDNTSDLNKPISTAAQVALDTLDEDKADKTDIATIESSTTASRAYSVGELVYVSGTLYRVKTAIASGATFTAGTNVEVTNVSDTVNAISAYDENPISVSSGFTVQKLPGNLVKISLTDYADAVTANVAKNTGKSVPSGYRPVHAGIVNCNIVNASAIVVASPRAVVDTNGNVSIAASDVGGVGYAIYGIYTLK